MHTKQHTNSAHTSRKTAQGVLKKLLPQSTLQPSCHIRDGDCRPLARCCRLRVVVGSFPLPFTLHRVLLATIFWIDTLQRWQTMSTRFNFTGRHCKVKFHSRYTGTTLVSTADFLSRLYCTRPGLACMQELSSWHFYSSNCRKRNLKKPDARDRST